MCTFVGHLLALLGAATNRRFLAELSEKRPNTHYYIVYSYRHVC